MLCGVLILLYGDANIVEEKHPTKDQADLCHRRAQLWCNSRIIGEGTSDRVNLHHALHGTFRQLCRPSTFSPST